MNDFGLLIGKYLSTLPTLSDTELSELQLDANGRLIISGRFLEDSAHSSGDPGLFVMAVRNDVEGSMVDADGDYAPLQVDDRGRLRVVADLEIVSSAEAEEDTPHVSGHIGNYVLAVRQDDRPANANTSDDGDYASFFVNNNGELYVKDTDTLAKLVEIETVLEGIEEDIESIEGNIGSLTHEEDTQHTSGDKGIMPLAVANEDLIDLVTTEGDYAPFAVNKKGQLLVRADAVIEPIGEESYMVTDAMAAAGDGLETITAAGTPWVTVASIPVADGEKLYLYGYQWACDQNASARIITDDTVDISVYKVSLNSSAKPVEGEQFSDGGRIEIDGAADLEVKLQIKKRAVPGGNANGTGSLHARIA